MYQFPLNKIFFILLLDLTLLSILERNSYFFLFLWGNVLKLWEVDNWEKFLVNNFFLALHPSHVFWLIWKNNLNLLSAFSIFFSVINILLFWIIFSFDRAFPFYSFFKKWLTLFKALFILLYIFEYRVSIWLLLFQEIYNNALFFYSFQINIKQLS